MLLVHAVNDLVFCAKPVHMGRMVGSVDVELFNLLLFRLIISNRARFHAASIGFAYRIAW